jgi:hypothetical protein
MEVRPMQVESISFGSLAALKVKKPGVELTIVTQVGPRIAELMEPGGQNILFWDPANFKSTRKRGDWFLFGGHRVWTTRPGADEGEETYAIDNGLCTVKTASRRGQVSRLVITGAEHPIFKIQRSLVIVDNGLDCSVDVLNRVTNTSDMLWSGGLWGLTCTNPEGCRYFIPLPTEKPPFGWSPFGVTLFPNWAGHTSPFPNPQLALTDKFLLVDPQGTETKVAIEVPGGWMGCHTSSVNFYKMVAYDPVAIDRCPNRSNFAFYIGPGNFMVEMEVMGPWRTLRPGETLGLMERWVLLPPLAPENVDFGQLKQFRKGL